MATPVKVDVLFDAGGKLKRGILALGAAFATSKVVELAMEQEQAIERMNTQLKLTGDFSQEASQDIQAFASTLQSTSTFGDEVILGQIALAKSFGATNEQAKLIAKTAADLSVSMGISLDSATEQVSKTLGGFAGRLGQAIPALKGLSSEALMAGEGVQLLSKRFAGAAAEQIKTFGGALQQLKNTFGDFLEEIGFIITKNPVVIKLVHALTGAFQDLGKSVRNESNQLRLALGKIAEGMLALAEPAMAITSVIGELASDATGGIGWFLMKIGSFLGKIEILLKKFYMTMKFVGLGVKKIFVQMFSEIFIGVGKLSKLIENELPSFVPDKFKKILSNITSRMTVFGKKSKEIVNETGKDILKLQKEISILDKKEPSKENFITKIAEGIMDVSESAGNMFRDLDTSKIVLLRKEIQGIVEDLKKAPKKIDIKTDSAIFQQQAATAGGRMQAGDVTAPSFEQRAASAGGRMQAGDVTVPAKVEIPWSDIGKNFISTISQGAEGARTFLTNSVSTFATAFLGPVGGVFGEIFNLFSQTPEKFEEMIRGFVEAIPQIISNIFVNLGNIGMILTESVLSAVEQLLENLPEMLERFIKKFVNDVPRIINKIISQVPRFINALIKAVPDIVSSFISEFVKSVPKIIEEFIKSITGLGGGDGGGLLGGIPIVGDVLGGIGSVFGFAKGGMVPDGFPNDTFPARLTSRELVIDRSLTNKLDSYLDGQQSNNDQTGLLNAILVELRKPMTVSSNLELDNRNFGQVILELNRDNERLEA